MLKLSKRHTLEIRQEVLVYFNLHKRVFSMKDVKTVFLLSRRFLICILTVKYKMKQYVNVS